MNLRATGKRKSDLDPKMASALATSVVTLDTGLGNVPKRTPPQWETSNAQIIAG